MIAGIGVDIVAVARIRELLARHGERFLQRVFAPAEIQYCLKRHDPSASLAARFAAKEAFVKAIGTGKSQGLRFHDVQVEGGGRPGLRLMGQAADMADQMGIRAVHVSLSHERDHAVAMVIVEVLP